MAVRPGDIAIGLEPAPMLLFRPFNFELEHVVSYLLSADFSNGNAVGAPHLVPPLVAFLEQCKRVDDLLRRVVRFERLSLLANPVIERNLALCARVVRCVRVEAIGPLDVASRLKESLDEGLCVVDEALSFAVVALAT